MSRETTFEELMATLKHSSMPTVLVEGKDDLFLYRQLERLFDPTKVSIQVAGNKSDALKLQHHLRASNFDHTVAFVDSDFWTIDGTPLTLPKGVLSTIGYSIENDIILFGGLLDLLDHKECKQFMQDLHRYASWYSIQIQFERDEPEPTFRESAAKVLCNLEYFEETSKKYQHCEICHSIIDQIVALPMVHVRGKNLFQVLLLQLAKNGRNPSHTKNGLIEFASKMQMKDYFKSLIDRVQLYIKI